jgi:hypothetical protein
MQENKLIRLLVTKYLILVISTIVIFILGVWYVLLKKDYPVETINKTVDTVFKLMAIVIGFVWFLNRYFSERKDIPKFDVEVKIDSVFADQNSRLLIYRLDLFNRANVLFSNFETYMVIDAIEVRNGEIIKYTVQKLPSEGCFTELNIEPNSWTAINAELLLNQKVLALRFYYEIRKKGALMWSWHKTYKV